MLTNKTQEIKELYFTNIWEDRFSGKKEYLIEYVRDELEDLKEVDGTIQEMVDLYETISEDDRFIIALDFFHSVFMADEALSLAFFLNKYEEASTNTFKLRIHDENNFKEEQYKSIRELLESVVKGKETAFARIFKNMEDNLALEIVEDNKKLLYTIHEIDTTGKELNIDYEMFTAEELVGEVFEDEETI